MIGHIQQGLNSDGLRVSGSQFYRWFDVRRLALYFPLTKSAPKVQEELGELQEAIEEGHDPGRVEEEFGDVLFALIKSFVFAFLVSSISAYKGYFTKGGALEVGQSSTSAVTNSCIAILVADYLLAQLLL